MSIICLRKKDKLDGGGEKIKDNAMNYGSASGLWSFVAPSWVTTVVYSPTYS